MEQIYYYTYKISSLIPEKPYYYFGRHKTKNLNDTYFGSGVKWLDVLQKYGKENFKFEILEYFNSNEEVNQAERDLIGDQYKSYWCLNCCEGGQTTFGWKHSEETKQQLRDRLLGSTQTEESNKKRSQKLKGRIFTEEHKQKIGNKHKNKVVSEGSKRTMKNNHADFSGQRNPMFGKNHSDETKQSLSKLKTGFVYSDERNMQISKRLKEIGHKVPDIKLNCPHCGMITNLGNYYRWHNDNCKSKMKQQ